MNKKIILLLAIILLIVIGIVLVNQNKIPQIQKSSFKVGVIAPLTGDFGVIGEELKNGIDLAIEQLQAKSVNISIVYEDDKFNLKEAATAANKLISVDKVDFAVLFSVEEARPTVSIFNNNKVPLVVLWDSNYFLRDAGQYIFSNGFSTEKAGQIMADFAYNKLNLRNVAVIDHVDAWSEIISKSFQNQFKNNGGKIVYAGSIQVGTSDFRLEITKIKNAKPDGIYAPLIPFDSVSFIKQVKQFNLNVPILSGDALIQDVIDATGKASDGIYFTNAYSDSVQLPALYKEKYGKDPYALVYVASAFDGIMKIGQALKPSENIKTTLDNLFGPTRATDRIEKIYKVSNGTSVEVK